MSVGSGSESSVVVGLGKKGKEVGVWEEVSGSGLGSGVLLVEERKEDGTVVECGVRMSLRLRAVPSEEGVVARERVRKEGGRARMSCRAR